MPDDSWAARRDELAAEVRRVADRLRSLSQTRLGRPCPPYPSAADAGRTAAAALAGAAAALEGAAGRAGESAGDRPDTHELPRLSDFAAGDQVAVTGHDLLAALDLVAPDADVHGRPACEAVAAAVAVLTDVRRLL